VTDEFVHVSSRLSVSDKHVVIILIGVESVRKTSLLKKSIRKSSTSFVVATARAHPQQQQHQKI